jgi:hypothetical protein
VSAWLPWVIALLIIVSIPVLVRWGRRNARGSAGGAAMMLGLAFGHLFDPAKAEATETLMKQRENFRQEEAAGDPPSVD